MLIQNWVKRSSIVQFGIIFKNINFDRVIDGDKGLTYTSRLRIIL